MKRPVITRLLVLVMALCLLLAACSQTPSAETETPEETEAVTTQEPEAAAEPTAEPEASAEPEDRIASGADNHMKRTAEEYAEEQIALQLEYAPEVKTLDNGVKIQRTPTEYAPPACSTLGDMAYNNYRLDADNRGCAACHESLTDLVQNMKLIHVDVQGCNDTEVTVQTCISCHVRFDYYLSDTQQFGTLIHGIHYGTDSGFTGNCMSCHNVTADGNGMQLWDLVKYDVLHGITDIAADDLQVEFNYDQDTIFPDDQTKIFSEEWYWPDSWDTGRHDARVSGEAGEEQFDFDTWEIKVHGAVKEEKTFTLGELINTAPIFDGILKFHCTADPIGSSMIANVHVKAIPLSYLIEQCGGYANDAVYVRATSFDGFYLDHLKERNTYLVYEINGERLTLANGYPVSMWVPAGSCGMDVKAVSDFYIGNDQNYYEYIGLDTLPSGMSNRPNATIYNTQDGQVIDAFEPYTFEGFADSYSYNITQVQFSFDRGATWKTFDIKDVTAEQWVHWTLTFTPSETTSYVVYVRAVNDLGEVSPYNHVIMVNAQ